jgi:uncharacterized protein
LNWIEMNLLHIFIKNARLGHVKTRLAATVGPENALTIYLELLQLTRQAARNSSVTRWLWYSEQVPEHDDWPAADFQKKVQLTGDLGDRMSAAFEAGFAAGATKSLIIGSDCPELTSGLIQQAFDALDRSDFVAGPTPDGGYYLLGMRSHAPYLFNDMAWSTETVLPDTLARIAQQGKTYSLLPELSDVDHEADWLAYQQRKLDI